MLMRVDTLMIMEGFEVSMRTSYSNYCHIEVGSFTVFCSTIRLSRL